MTLILSFICERYVVQVGDRRLTSLHDGSLYDDNTNKCVLYDGRVAFSYTGPAEIERQPTHLWLANVLAAAPRRDFGVIANHIAETATSAFGAINLPQPNKRAAFVGVGWSFPTPDASPIPFALEISNFSAGSDFTKFEVKTTELLRSGHRELLAAGQAPPIHERGRLEFLLRHLMKKRASPDAIVGGLARAIRHVAGDNRKVGKRLLSVVIPKGAVTGGRQQGAFTAVTGPWEPGSTDPTFQYWEDGIWNGITYGPTVVAPGIVLTNLKSGPILPRLGGLTSVERGRVSVQYPIALLHGPGGGLIGRTVRDVRYVAAFTEADLLESFRDTKAPRASPVLVTNPQEFRDVLASVRHKFDRVMFNPNAADDQKADVKIDDILGSHWS